MAAIGRRRWRGRSNQGATDHAVRLSSFRAPAEIDGIRSHSAASWISASSSSVT